MSSRVPTDLPGARAPQERRGWVGVAEEGGWQASGDEAWLYPGRGQAAPRPCARPVGSTGVGVSVRSHAPRAKALTQHQNKASSENTQGWW